MAMLAEPRRRKRYNLCPRGKALYEDDNRFGTKMLEKMGWSKGNGLGARQDGEKDFVRIRFKNDAEGLGYEAKDDQWTTHEEGFNGLLKSLNGGEDDKEANGKESESEEEARPMGFGFKSEDSEEPSKKKLKENISGMSLEARSKQSKARVHYQKFTRGKDLSQYSEKDLANIFGKKATEDIAAPVVIEEPKEEKNVSPNFGGVQTVSTGLSVSDYFKQKMEAIKNRLKNGTTQDNGVGEAREVIGEETKAENVSEEPLKKKKKKNSESTVEPAITEPKKKKKSKRSSQDEAEVEETFVEPEPVEKEETSVKKKKKNKKEKKDKIEDTAEAVIETMEVLDEPAPKKKKKSKKAELTESEVILIDDNSNSRDEQSTNESVTVKELARKKKKKSKKCQENQLEAGDANGVSEEKETPPKKKKKSEQDKSPIEPEETVQIDSHAPDSTEKSSKKKKKSKTNVDEPVPEDANPELEPSCDSVEEPSFKKIRDKGGKHRDTEVSAASKSFGDKSDQSADKDQPEDLLSLEEIKDRLKSFNTIEISQFCAEKFQSFDMSQFRNSTLSKIMGYATNENVELKVVECRNDEQRIIDLWNNRSAIKYKKTKNSRYPRKVKRTTIRAVKKRVAFQGI